ncbi:redoxin domain-containing protein [Marinilongibacter aquaticus]|uniref:TlpA family protein disulfide reductase n=1 Tax=Marinilongibacter aquaticus TaxID=2975157 RepID=UPI0021BD5EFA|nr:redoxin domain-containing protein [Marinilongibacter aquaticus]UBM59623.1 redoxin domain-containing protein [Marinilongibacter aquaticus]
MKLLFTLLSLLAVPVFAQQTFQMSGHIDQADGSQLIMTLYRNWIAMPEDYTIEVDSAGHFHADIVLDEPAYIDLNYGLNGLLFQLIEPEDSVYLSFESQNFYKSFFVSGRGAAKWDYYKQVRFGFEQDESLRFQRELKGNPGAYGELVAKTKKAQLEFLDRYQNKVSEVFYRLRRADIEGRYNQFLLNYYARSEAYLNPFDKFELLAVDPELQVQSFEYNQFVEELLQVYRQKLNAKPLEDIQDEYAFVMYLFEQNLLNKKIALRLLATRLANDFALNGLNSANETAFQSLLVFDKEDSSIKILDNLYQKLRNQKIGEPAPAFSILDFKGRNLSLKNLKGSYVILAFWSSWCAPCKQDLAYLPIVENFFRSKTKLKVFNIAIDSPEDFESVRTFAESTGQGARVDLGENWLESYGVSNLPRFVLIDKAGNWLRLDLTPPSLDEGRALIKELEQILTN